MWFIKRTEPLVGYDAEPPQRIAPHLGSMTISTVPGPVLRDLGNGTGDRDKTQVPRGHREGDRGPRAALIITTDRMREI